MTEENRESVRMADGKREPNDIVIETPVFAVEASEEARHVVDDRAPVFKSGMRRD